MVVEKNMEKNKNYNKKLKKYFNLWSKIYQNKIDRLFNSFSYLKWALKQICTHLSIKKDSKVLELGCGGGNFLEKINAYFKGKGYYIGLDISKEQIKLAREKIQKDNIKFIQGNMIDLPFKNDSIDYIVSCSSLHHVANKKKLFCELHRVLKNNGKLVYCDFFLENNSEKYTKKVKKVRDKSKWSKKFSGDIQRAYNLMPEFLKKMHPTDYYIDPYKTKKILLLNGFKKCEIILSPDTRFAGISAQKLLNI